MEGSRLETQPLLQWVRRRIGHFHFHCLVFKTLFPSSKKTTDYLKTLFLSGLMLPVLHSVDVTWVMVLMDFGFWYYCFHGSQFCYEILALGGLAVTF